MLTELVPYLRVGHDERIQTRQRHADSKGDGRAIVARHPR